MVLEQHEDDLEVLAHDRRDLLRQHLVRAVTDDRHDLTARGGELGAHRRGDLVPHAREAVLEVVLLRAARAPQRLQVAGHGPGGVDEDVVVAHELVERAEHLGLRGQRGIAPVVALVGDSRPRGNPGGDLGRVVGPDAIALERRGEGLEPGAGVGDDHLGGVLRGIEGEDVEVDEPHARVAEHRVAGRGEVGVPGAYPDDDVGLGSECIRGVVAGGADAADRGGVLEADRTLACLGVGDRDARRVGERHQRGGAFRVDDPAPRDHQRTLRGPDDRHGPGDRGHLRGGPGHVPDALAEELRRPVERLGLHVLGQADRHGASLGRVGQHPHRGERARDQLLGPVDAVPEPRDRFESVVDGDVQTARVLQLLEHGVRHTGGEDVRRQDQHGDPVDGRQRCARNHVERPGSDRRRARECLQPITRAGVGDRGVHHALLVAREVVLQPVLPGRGVDLVLQQGLPDASHIPVSEDAERSGDEPLLDPIPLAELAREEADQRLTGSQADRSVGGGRGVVAHWVSFVVTGVGMLAEEGTGAVMGSRGSTAWEAQVSRIQWWVGSSVISQAPSWAGPAMTLR